MVVLIMGKWGKPTKQAVPKNASSRPNVHATAQSGFAWDNGEKSQVYIPPWS